MIFSFVLVIAQLLRLPRMSVNRHLSFWLICIVLEPPQPEIKCDTETDINGGWMSFQTHLAKNHLNRFDISASLP